MSIGSILSIANSALSAQQAAIQVASQNISNANTAGYTRQRIDEVAGPSVQMPYGNVGSGVVVADITRTRDALMDASYRSDAGDAAKYHAQADALTQIDATFGEPSDTGLSATMDAFWSSWDDLSAEPTSTAAASVVQARGQALASTFNQLSSQISDIANNSQTELSTDVTQVNSLLSQVATLNPQIAAAEAGGHSANDLRDDLDRTLDQLGTLTGATSVERTDGSTAVFIGGRLMVDRDLAHTLVVGGGNTPTLGIDSASDPITVGGSVGGLQTALTTEIPQVMGRLDALAKGVVQQVNAIHTTGVTFNPTAQPAGNFFDVTVPPPAGGDPLLTAAGIRLAPTLTSGAAVAASGATATGPGDNGAASAIALLRTAPVNFTAADGSAIGPATSFDGFFRQSISDLGLAEQTATDSATTSDTLASNADTRRQSVEGVSTDEELVDIINHQQAYSAAARVISVVQDMTETLINIGLS